MADGTEGRLPEPIVATTADLPEAVAAALANPSPPRRSSVPAAGYTFAVRSWGDPGARPLLLVHGVTASSATWWRMAPALAATGRQVVAPDLPGHGQTGGWRGRQRFADTAEDLLAFVRAAGLDRPELEVIAHSWGAMICAELPASGLRPRVLILFDPPTVSLDWSRSYVQDPEEQPIETMAEAVATLRARNPTWTDGDVEAKAEGLTLFDEPAARAVMLQNGDWDSGLAALAKPAARPVPVWIVKGETRAGSLVADDVVPRLVRRVGADHVLTITDGEHSPQRQRPEATLVAFLRALDG